MNLEKPIWEGWTAQDFIDELQFQADMIMAGQAIRKPFKNRKDIEKWCCENQPYKKPIPEVVDYFCERYALEEK